MDTEAKAIMFDMLVEYGLTIEELDCAAQFDDSLLPWRSQYIPLDN